MTKGLILALLFFLMTGFVVVSTLISESGSEANLIAYEGILVDTKCYAMDSRNYTNDHESAMGKMANCATGCAAMGIPVGLLKDGREGGEVHVLLVPSKMLAEHMGKWARVTGTPSLAGSMLVDKIEVKGKDGKYEKVDIVTMM